MKMDTLFWFLCASLDSSRNVTDHKYFIKNGNWIQGTAEAMRVRSLGKHVYWHVPPTDVTIKTNNTVFNYQQLSKWEQNFDINMSFCNFISNKPRKA